MSNLELKIAPSKIMFTIWLKSLIANGRAKFVKNYQNVIALNAGPLSTFGIGRHTITNHPIFCVPRPMLPWFCMGKISRAIIENRKNIYLEFGDNTSPLYLKLAPIKNRAHCLITLNEDTEDIVKTIDFHGYYIDKDENLHLTKALNRAPLELCDSFTEILPEESYESEEWLTDESQFIDIYDIDNYENSKF